MALTETSTRLVPPFGIRIRMRCKFGRNSRLVMLVTCVPMPPLFLLCPLRLMDLPLVGRLPVIAQILAMVRVVKGLGSKGVTVPEARGISIKLLRDSRRMQHLEFLSKMRWMQKLHQGQFALAEAGRLPGCDLGDEPGRVMHEERLL